MKKIPYGVSNFRNLIEENNIYLDKTHFIEILENRYKFVSFLRPRRFGKSLFISTLSYYYDEYYKDISDDLFKDTYIAKKPTPKKSSYKILFLEFSGITTKNLDTIERDFTNKISSLLRSYLSKYKYKEDKINFLVNLSNSEDLITEFFEIVKNDKIYVLIDEYDNFANSLLSENIDNFKKILGKGGFVRSFYEVIKTATLNGIVDRLFVTGVTPITMDTMTSGFNILENITNSEEFNELAGFNLEETKIVLNHLFQQCSNLNSKNTIEDILKLYNGYLFSLKAKNKIVNSTMLLYFIQKFDTKRCEYPEQLLDVNVASDYRKIMQLFQIGNIEENYQVLQELIKNNTVRANLKEKFEFDKGFYRDDFITLLYSLGFVTQNKKILTQTEFIIPSYTIKRLYFDYFKIELENRSKLKFSSQQIENSIIELALNNNITLFKNEAKSIIKLLSNRDFIKFDEKNLKVILLTLLNLGTFYYIKSEPEYNNKYPDIMLLKQKPFDDVKYQYLFELKWVKKTKPTPQSRSNSTMHPSQKGNYRSWEDKKEEGIEQIKSYLRLDEIKNLENLKSYLIISDIDNLEIIEVS
jgi:hypothetical protein